MSADQRAPQPEGPPPELPNPALAAFVDFMNRGQLKVGYYDADGNLLDAVPVTDLIREGESIEATGQGES